MSSIVFSHGFGVRKDSRGMFTDIAQALSNFECDLFDYNELLEGGDVRVRPFSEQVKILNDHIVGAGDEDITLICHSQGCVIASLADTSNVGKIILLAPPTELSVEHFMQVFGSREGIARDSDGTLAIPRTDGTTTFVGRDYLDELTGVDVLAGYQKLADLHDVTIVRATTDNILGETSFDGLVNVKIIDIEADHDFTGTARTALIRYIAEEVSNA